MWTVSHWKGAECFTLFQEKTDDKKVISDTKTTSFTEKSVAIEQDNVRPHSAGATVAECVCLTCTPVCSQDLSLIENVRGESDKGEHRLLSCIQ